MRVLVEEKDEGKKKLGFEIVESREKIKSPSDDGEDEPEDDDSAKRLKASKRPAIEAGQRRQKKSDGSPGDGKRSSLVPKVPLAP